ncbi:L,D-transpeptidase family protein [Pedobacter chinensis]|uniref:L,D-transpeptidase family protein n=1 Tax=Pedobacter chinensis TaxID=2282421 RepID=UPI001F00276F|nr:L,D-transpeptidase family protein [Pedobacter chinensis]
MQKGKKAQKKKLYNNASIAGHFSSQLSSTFDSTAIDSFLKKFPLFDPYEAEIVKFYDRRKYAYAWFEHDTLIEHAGNLANRIAGMEEDGIHGKPPYLREMDSLLHTPLSKNTQEMTELMLTAQYFVFARMAWEGMTDEESRANSWFLPRKRLSYNGYLDSILKLPLKNALSTEPVYRQYELLKSFLTKYRTLEKTESWLPVKLNRFPRLGDSSEAIQLIRQRLILLGDLPAKTESAIFDEPLAEGFRNFQIRHGLKPSGTMDALTLNALNIPLKERITQILINMERSRWLPVTQEGEYLAVNIPEFKLHVYDTDSLLWSCNVVVGKTMNRTTVFYGELESIVFSPYWNVPPSIVKKEILPGMRSRSNFLESHQMEIVGSSDGLPIIRQRPGKNNSLGQVKFLFPNSHNIYLHDTPSRSLFLEPARAFSHGCIRVAEPRKLAEFLLKDSPQWPSDKIISAMQAGKEIYVPLKKKTPVYIAYFTAFVDRKHQLNFRQDIYHLDDRLAAMLLSGKGNY